MRIVYSLQLTVAVALGHWKIKIKSNQIFSGLKGYVKGTLNIPSYLTILTLRWPMATKVPPIKFPNAYPIKSPTLSHMTCNKNPLWSVDYSQNKCLGFHQSSFFLKFGFHIQCYYA